MTKYFLYYQNTPPPRLTNFETLFTGIGCNVHLPSLLRKYTSFPSKGTQPTPMVFVLFQILFEQESVLHTYMLTCDVCGIILFDKIKFYMLVHLKLAFEN